MQQSSAKTFKKAIEFDPAWASKLTEAMEVTEYCDMGESPITHLSPLLHFTAIDSTGLSADFTLASQLKVAEGMFAGCVDFSNSSIQEIGRLECGEDKRGYSVLFAGCKSLKIATGTYPGAVSFTASGIEKIENLECGKNEEGDSAHFFNCKNLKLATGKYVGNVDFNGSGIVKIQGLECGENESGDSACFKRCKELKIAEGSYTGYVTFRDSGIEKITDLKCPSVDLCGCPHLIEIPASLGRQVIEVFADGPLLRKYQASRKRDAAKKIIQAKIITL